MCSTEGRCPLLEHKSILSHLASSLSTLDYPRYQVILWTQQRPSETKPERLLGCLCIYSDNPLSNPLLCYRYCVENFAEIFSEVAVRCYGIQWVLCSAPPCITHAITREPAWLLCSPRFPALLCADRTSFSV